MFEFVQQLSLSLRRCNNSAPPKHFPFSLRKCRTYASLRLNVFLHPPIMNIPLCSYMFSSSIDAPGTPHSSASMTGTPQHTQDASSSARVCVAMCRFRSGERRFRCTCAQYGHFHLFDRDTGGGATVKYEAGTFRRVLETSLGGDASRENGDGDDEDGKEEDEEAEGDDKDNGEEGGE